MKKLIRRLLISSVLILVVVLTVAMLPSKTPSLDTSNINFTNASLIGRGEYLAAAGDCVACHTAPGAQPYAGGFALESPLGLIYSTNITPDRETGIGHYTLDDFDRAVRYGISPSGDALYPAMPFPSYARMNDEDLIALYAYFMHGVEPVVQENSKVDIPWPLSMRWPLIAWRKAFALTPAQWQEQAPTYDDPVIARGAYLVQGLGHCGSCHTPRSWTMKEKAYWEASRDFLAGGPVIDGWLAVNLRSDDADGLGRWSPTYIIDTLRSGRNDEYAVLGHGMSDVVLHSTQHLHDEDLQAIAVYLKQLSPANLSSSFYQADTFTAEALASGVEESRGAELFVDNCAACHRTNGLGHRGVFPTIAGNPSVLAENPISLIRVILAGSRLPSTRTAPSDLGMPGFAWRLSDDEVAQLSTFIRQSWGNEANSVSVEQVTGVRQMLDDLSEQDRAIIESNNRR
jgi:mono/diheme cytochrome c family protein